MTLGCPLSDHCFCKHVATPKALAFRKGAKSLSWTTWWQNMKVYVIVAGFLLLLITIVVVKMELKKKKQN
jgi:hypothetical protein